jgi:transposase
MGWSSVLLPRQQAKLARGAKDKEHAMSQTPNTTIAVIGIDRQELVPRRGPRCARCHRAAAKVVAWPSGGAARQYTALPDRHGSDCVGAHHLSRRLTALGHEPCRKLPVFFSGRPHHEHRASVDWRLDGGSATVCRAD